MNGKGKFIFTGGKVYVGDFVDDKRQGFGVMTWYTRGFLTVSQ